ncbi:MAG: PilZ domain-containing protein [bacterium]
MGSVLEMREIKHKIAQVERREHYRIHLSELDPRLFVTITINSGMAQEVKLINYSLGGVLFYAEPSSNIKKGDSVPVIAFKFPNKPVIEFSGKFIRVEKSRDKLFCAVSFDEKQKLPLQLQNQIDTELPLSPAKAAWIEIIKAIPNYTRDSTVDLYHDALRAGYEKFNRVVKDFRLEEKWWFFELLDELKRREPYYPKDLLDEFVSMCEKGEGVV